MPLFMDQHLLPGVKAKDVAEAHRLDMLVQGEHGCQCMTYWVDEKRGNVFCLIEAPDKESVSAMHQKAHGLVPNKVIEVSEDLVESFLGRIADPEHAKNNNEGIKVFEDSSMRVILMIKMTDPFLYAYREKEKDSIQWIDLLNQIRNIIKEFQGREAECKGNYLVASFTTARNALNAASAIFPVLNQCKHSEDCPSISMEAGEPVEGSHELFGDVLHKLIACCFIENKHSYTIATGAGSLLAKDQQVIGDHKGKFLMQDEEKFLLSIIEEINKHYQDADYDLNEVCHGLAMSTSQLYRKSIAVFGIPPNVVLKKIRLQKAKELLANKNNNISQVSFDTGFTSPSYFTKCFKSQYGLLPQTYQQLIQAS